MEWTERLRFFSHVVTKPQRTGPRQRQPLPSDGDPDLVARREDRERADHDTNRSGGLMCIQYHKKIVAKEFGTFYVHCILF
jgi:hypothetical protein